MNHTSQFYLPTDDGVGERIISLSEGTSQWLLQTGLWDSINRELGTFYMEYEDDELTPAALEQTVAAIEGFLLLPQNTETTTLSDHEARTDDLTKLLNLLRYARGAGRVVIASL